MKLILDDTGQQMFTLKLLLFDLPSSLYGFARVIKEAKGTKAIITTIMALTPSVYAWLHHILSAHRLACPHNSSNSSKLNSITYNSSNNSTCLSQA
jgi:hypothetical protein